MGPLGPMGTQIRPYWSSFSSKNCRKLTFLLFLAPKWWKKVEIEGVGPPWRDSQRNSAPGRGPQVPNGATATHLVTKRYDLGSLGVPGPASTPLKGLTPFSPGGADSYGAPRTPPCRGQSTQTNPTRLMTPRGRRIFRMRQLMYINKKGKIPLGVRV